MMRNLILTFAVFAMAFGLQAPVMAQISAPAPSPGAEFTQMVGLTEISVAYSRPGKKERTIFSKDGLVPFGDIWRTGANSATKISFSDDVKVAGAELSAGDYAILTRPMATSWEVMFFPYESTNWGSYVEKNPAAAVEAEVEKLNRTVESFTIQIDALRNEGAILQFIWDNTVASLPIEVNTDDKVMASINRVMEGPSAGDYYAAASYYHDAGKDLKQALKWIQMANQAQPRFWTLRKESLILADLGMTKEAIEVAKKSLKMAKEAGNKDYVRMNEASIAEWKKM